MPFTGLSRGIKGEMWGIERGKERERLGWGGEYHEATYIFARQLIRQSKDPKVSSAKSFVHGRTPNQAEGRPRGLHPWRPRGSQSGREKAGRAKEPAPSPVLEDEGIVTGSFLAETQHVSLAGPKFLKKKLKQNLNCNLTTSNTNKKQGCSPVTI